MKKVQNNVSVNHELGNDTKPLLCEVAVVTPKYRDFIYWVEKNQKENEVHTWIFNVDKIRGKRFNRIEKLYNYHEIQDINEIMDYLETHTVSNLT
jgi:hypothetical protein